MRLVPSPAIPKEVAGEVVAPGPTPKEVELGFRELPELTELPGPAAPYRYPANPPTAPPIRTPGIMPFLPAVA